MKLQGTVLVDGSAEGSLLVLEEAVNLWNGFEAVSGRITAHDHPQDGVSLMDRVVWFETKGATAGGSLTEALRMGKGPAAVLLRAPDTSVVVACTVARELYGVNCPVLLLEYGPDWMATSVPVAVSKGGVVVKCD